ncbi:Signal transduction histidine-protein kinase BarA [Oceanimonas sp. MB9]|nr:Signal transduction histidine-protein kinase BarA [Oceanimonas sp. MB9]
MLALTPVVRALLLRRGHDSVVMMTHSDLFFPASMRLTHDMTGAFTLDARKRRWLMLPAILLLLLIINHGHQLFRQYQDGRQLLRHAEPIVDELYHIHHQVMMPDAEGAVLLDDKVRRLSLMLARFQYHVRESGLTMAEGDRRPDAYLKTLQGLQQAELHARHSLESFANQAELRLKAGDNAALKQLLQHSRVYLYTTNPLFVRELEWDARGLEMAGDDLLQAHGIYTANLRRLIAMRHKFADTDIADFYDWISWWHQRTEQSRDRLLALVMLLLLGLFGAGVGLLYVNNRRLRQASDTARALAQAKTDFLANMSHEIRTPMNAITGFVSLLQQTPLDARQSDYVAKIRMSSDNLLLLINDILDLTRVEAGKLQLEDIDFDLNEQLERLSGLFADMSEQKQLEVIIDKAPDVPDRLRGDPLRLGQILVNLVNNALKFTERGEVVVRIASGNQGNELRFEVSDTGIGIMPEQQQQLFQSFTQVDASTTRKYGGSGLGLSICRHLVELMHGTITVSSQPGRGSTFTVVLPLRPAGEAVALPEPALAPGLGVLVVEDNPLAAEVMGKMLRRAGMVVHLAHNTEMARELLQKRGGDLRLALIDCCLGRDNGLDVARFIRQQPQLDDLNIIVVSAFGRERPAAQMKQLGIKHYLPKPVTWSRLSASLAAVLTPPPSSARAASPVDNDLEYYRRRLAGCRVLLAEDNRLNQQLVVEFLTRVEVSVSLADNGRQAVEQASRHRFDAILMDLQMPILDGLEATRQIRKLLRHHDVPIIALTASAMRSDRESSLDSGMNGYLSKPLNRLDLYLALSRYCGGQPGSDDHADAMAADNDGGPARDGMLAERCGDQLWLLQAAQAEADWAEATRLLQELIRYATAAGESSLAGLAEAALVWPERGQPLPHAELSLLQQRLNRALEQDDGR